MATFTDANGLDWHIAIDLGTVYRYKKVTGIDIFKSAAAEMPASALWELAYFAVKDIAKQRGYADIESWLSALGKASAIPLSQAVAVEIADFFPEAKEALSGSDPLDSDSGNGVTSSDSQENQE